MLSRPWEGVLVPGPDNGILACKVLEAWGNGTRKVVVGGRGGVGGGARCLTAA